MGRVPPGTSGTLEGSITALADALSSLESAAPSAAAPSDKARRGLDFEPLQRVSCKPCACVRARLCHCHSCSVPVLTAALGSSYIARVIRHFRQPAMCRVNSWMFRVSLWRDTSQNHQAVSAMGQVTELHSALR